MKKSDVVLMLGAAILLSAGAVQAKGLDAPVTLNGISAQRMSDKELVAVEAKGNFYKGYCTWYVDDQVRKNWGSKFKTGVPWQGNAKDWYNNSKGSSLVARTDDPKKDAIVIYKAVKGYDTQYGHVAYVTSKDGSNFKVSEMNYKGFNVVSTRNDTTKNNNKIAGFIYKK